MKRGGGGGRSYPALDFYGTKEATDFLCATEKEPMESAARLLVRHVRNRMLDAIDLDRAKRPRPRSGGRSSR